MQEQQFTKTSSADTPVGVNIMGLTPEAQAMFDSIARRAYDLFERNGRQHGYDLDHWLQAESELFEHTPLTLAESQDGVTVFAEVPGYSPRELEVELEPRRVTIIGKHQQIPGQKKNGNPEEHSGRSLLQILKLPMEVDTHRVSVHLNKGILELDLKKASAPKAARTRGGSLRHVV